MSTPKPDKLFCIIKQNNEGTFYDLVERGGIVATGGPFGAAWVKVHDASRPAKIVVAGSLIPPAPDDGVPYSDTLKITQLTGKVDIEVQGDITGGTEDVVDVTRCKGDITLSWSGIAVPKGRFLSTIKGETDGFTLRGTVSGHGSETDVDLGNIYNAGGVKMNGKTRNVRLDLTSTDCIKVRPLSADNPVILNPSQSYKIDKWARVFWPIYLLFHK